MLAASVPVGPVRLSLHALASVLLGAALGLVAYVGVTDAVNYRDQSALRRGLDLAVASAPVLRSYPAGLPAMDLEGWEALDGAYWRSLPAGGPFARIVVPKMDLDAVVVKGTAARDLRKGPGWIVTTDLPGASGNVGSRVIALRTDTRSATSTSSRRVIPSISTRRTGDTATRSFACSP